MKSFLRCGDTTLRGTLIRMLNKLLTVDIQRKVNRTGQMKKLNVSALDDVIKSNLFEHIFFML